MSTAPVDNNGTLLFFTNSGTGTVLYNPTMTIQLWLFTAVQSGLGIGSDRCPTRERGVTGEVPRAKVDLVIHSMYSEFNRNGKCRKK